MGDKNLTSASTQNSTSNDSFETNNSSSLKSFRYALTYDNRTKTKLKKDALEYVDCYKEFQQDPKYKTEMCKSWSESGFCAYGNKCRFAHGKGELFEKVISCKKYKQKDCMSFFNNRYCCYGSRCHFRHEERKIKNMNRSYYNFLLSNLSYVTGTLPGDVLDLENEVLMLILSANKPAKSGKERLPVFNSLKGNTKKELLPCEINMKICENLDLKNYLKNLKGNVNFFAVSVLKEIENKQENENSLGQLEFFEKKENIAISYFNYEYNYNYDNNVLPMF